MCNVVITLTWDFELDETLYNEIEINKRNEDDTRYGELSYKFHNENSDKPSIELKVDIIASQTV